MRLRDRMLCLFLTSVYVGELTQIKVVWASFADKFHLSMSP